jgi:hypothetical protein
MDEARAKILRMLEEGKINGDQAARLLDTIETTAAATPPPAKGKAPRWLKIQVQEKGREKPNVKVTLPFALVRLGLKLAPLGMKFAPAEAQEKIAASGLDLATIDADAIAQAFGELGEYALVDIDDEDGDKVKIWVE